MASQLKNSVAFVGVASGATVALPHGLNQEGTAVVPDKIEVDNGNFVVVAATDTTVSVRNDGVAAGDVNVLCERWWSAERVLPDGVTDLTPQPFVPAAGGSGVSNPITLATGDAVVTAPGGQASIAAGHSPAGNVAATIRVGAAGSGFAAGWGEGFAGSTVDIASLGRGSFASGYIGGAGASAVNTLELQATGPGSFAQGNIEPSGTGDGYITASGDGAQAFGSAYANNANPSLVASGDGAVARGRASANAANANITSSGPGSFASGFASDGDIVASGDGASAIGEALNGGSITASGPGCFAAGYAQVGAIVADGPGCFAIGHSWEPAAYQAAITAYYWGAFAGGFAYAAGANAYIYASYGSLAFGYALTGTIEAQFTGSVALGTTAGGTLSAYSGFVFGYASGGLIHADNQGAMALGHAYGAGSYIDSIGNGSIASGYAGIGCEISASASGARAHGDARRSVASGYIYADGAGSFAGGYCNNGEISTAATAEGAFAFGRIVPNFIAGTEITADGDGSVAMGNAFGGAAINSTGQGSIALGSATQNSVLQSVAEGSFACGRSTVYGTIDAGGAGGWAGGAVTGANSTIDAQATASFSRGFCSDGGDLIASGIGATAFGYISDNQANVGADLEASGLGAFAGGCINSPASTGIASRDIRAADRGAFAHGCVGGSSTYASELLANGYGAWAGGYCYATTDTANITSTGRGSFAGGCVDGNGDPTSIEATDDGCFAFGTANGVGGTAQTLASDEGCMAFGRNRGGYITSSRNGSLAFGNVLYDGRVQATNDAAFAFGSANGAGSRIIASEDSAMAFGVVVDASHIYSSGRGSLAAGYADNSYDIIASGDGAVAFGRATAADIQATQTNAFQFGEGTNALANTSQFGVLGTGIRLNHTGAPGAPSNGDIWVAGGYVYIRSNGVSCKCVNAAM